MREKDLIDFIRGKHDNEGKSFKEITLDLQKMGHKSKRTDKPIAEGTVRYIYNYGRRGMEEPKEASSEAVSTLQKMKRVLENRSLSATQKIEMLELLLSS